jgi:hypothetical protein
MKYVGRSTKGRSKPMAETFGAAEVQNNNTARLDRARKFFDEKSRVTVPNDLSRADNPSYYRRPKGKMLDICTDGIRSPSDGVEE